MKILVLFSSVEGHTKKIASEIASQLEKSGAEVFLTNVTDPGYCDPGVYDAAILCAPIHIGEYPSAFIQYIQNWKSALKSIPTAMISVSLAIISDDPSEKSEAEAYTDQLLEKTGWIADHVHHAAGALKYLEYDFFKRWVMRRIVGSESGMVDTSKDYELTDWKALSEFVGEFEKALR